MNNKGCIICENDNKNTESYIKHINFEIIYCNNCGLYFQSIKKGFGSLKDIYSNIYKDKPQSFQRASYINKRIKNYHRDIRMYQNKIGSLLDIGCSYGILMEYFINNGWSAVGIDINKNAINYAKSKGLDCFESSLEDFRTEKKFDLIVMSHVLEHLDRPLEYLRRIKEWLSDGGIIYIRVPNVESRPLIFKRKSFIGDMKPFEHFLYFNKNTLGFILKKAGLNSYIKVDGRLSVGDIVNCYFRSKFILTTSFNDVNYKTKLNNKKSYLLIKSIYEKIISILEYIPAGPRNREIVAVAKREDLA